MERFTTAQVLPSLMSADVLRLGTQLDALIAAGARTFHIDVMDGHFVPNLTLGTGFAAAVADPVRAAGGMLDVHLMVERPGLMVELFAPHAGAISVHVESDPHIHRLLGRIRELGCLAGIALNPATPLQTLEPLVEVIDYVVVMSINPGFAGQPFLMTTPARVAQARQMVPSRVAIEVDGGIGEATLPLVRDAGASLFVSASSIFGAKDPIAAYASLQALTA